MQVISYAEAAEMVTGRVIRQFNSSNELERVARKPFNRIGKRLFDLLIALMAMPFLLLAIICAGTAIKFESGGRIFFHQKRMGHCQRVFTMLKFRSMFSIKDSGHQPGDCDHEQYITAVGRVIRKYHIDELPQVLNVLGGQMSLVGPRPEALELYYKYVSVIPEFRLRQAVLPGLTGWAQVEQGYTNSVTGAACKSEYDLFYMKHFGFWLDLVIIIKTIGVILRKPFSHASA